MSSEYEIFDCHLHVEEGLDQYPLSLRRANVIFNSIDSYIKYSQNYTEFYHSLIFDPQQPIDFYKAHIIDQKIIALKLHSRILKMNEHQYDEVINQLMKLEHNIPIIYDAFYYGGELEYQPSLSGLIKLIRAFPNRKFVIAHSGGYEVLKYFFHLRSFENIGYDLSFSLQYLSDSSCYKDLVKLINYTPKDKIFFGSDFPGANPEFQLKILLDISDHLRLNNNQLDGILNTNWERFIGLK